MCRLLYKYLFALLGSLVSLSTLHAQFTPALEVGVHAGTLVYQGDLAAHAIGYTHSLHPAVGIYVSKPLDDYFSLRVNLQRGRIEADESTYAEPAWRRMRNFAFNTSITELTATIAWNPWAKIDRYDMRRWSPYFFAGAGVTVLNVHRSWSRFDATFFGPKSSTVTGLAVDTVSATPSMVVVVPVGAGIRYAASDRVSIFGEGNYRITRSDLIDGFRYSADPASHDYYYGLSVGISYRFGYNQMDCPRPKW